MNYLTVRKILAAILVLFGWLFLILGISFALDACIPKSEGPFPLWEEFVIGSVLGVIGFFLRRGGKALTRSHRDASVTR